MRDSYQTRSALLALLLSLPIILAAQTSIQHRVFLYGNMVDTKDKTAFQNRLQEVFKNIETPFTLVLNGDLVDHKLEKEDGSEALASITAIIDLINDHPNGTLIIVPGDRDWNSSHRGGEKSLQRLEEQVKDYWDDMDKDRFHWAGDNGCPGPEEYELGPGLIVAALNTQWWNHPYDKPREADALCDGLTADNLKEALEDIIEESRDKNVLILGHHPVRSMGQYGGYFSIGQHLSPLPVVGSFRTAYHANAGNSFDLVNEHLHPYIELLKTVLYSHDNLIYASGHEANQQILTFGNNYLINSGAPMEGKFAAHDANTVYSASTPGIMEITYYDDGKVETALWEYLPETGLERQPARALFHSACTTLPNEDQAFVNTSYIPCKEQLVKAVGMSKSYAAPVQIAAGPEYTASGWKRLWFGDHYRASWLQSIQTHYLNLDTTFGGLTIYKKGGGRQTTSLKFRSADGTVYTFRSVDKDPAKSLSYDLQETIAVDVIRDQTSSQQPYGAMAVAPLLEKLNILHVTPTLYRLPDDPKLGPFRPKYGNLFGMLEENPGKENNAGELFAGADEIDKSADMYRHFYKHQTTRLQLDEFVRARLFDILIGDWSKHEDNWKWAAFDKGNSRTYRPIPRDRDHAFSRQDGIINWIADRPFGIPTIQNFGYKFHGIRSLTYQARHMDRFLMGEAPKQLFMEQAKYIQDHISDADIEAAVHNMPPEIYEHDGKVIKAKLKNRVRHLNEAAATYYGLLAREVDVIGSNEKEYFLVNYLDNGDVQVRMFDIDDHEKGDKLLFDRTFHPAETKEVRLWALGDDDQFAFIGGKSPIRLRAFGGPGGDLFHDAAKAGSLLYDKGDGTEYDLNGSAKIVHHWNKDLYEYQRNRFAYNHSSPIVGLAYSSALGIGGQIGYSFKFRKYNKEDYHSMHSIVVGATTEGNKTAVYSGRFHQVLRKWDLLVKASIDDATVRNRFFGIGNDTPNETDKFGVDYYQPLLSNYVFSLGLKKDFWQHSGLQFKLGLEQHDSKRVDNTFLSDTFESIYGAHQAFKMLPAGVELDIDFRDEPGLPYRGIRLLTTYQYYALLGDGAADRNFGVASGDLEYYLSSRNKHPLTLGLRLGGAFSHGQVPWYKLPTLGFTNGLRGYVETRFAGTSNAYFNTELRYQLMDKPTSIVPVKVGIKVFYDRGRV
ncbi:MAG: hypothetical protein KDD15_28465, partial [Lewinella sp.]|nr:hypothetical protein [Lewinella sp.]